MDEKKSDRNSTYLLAAEKRKLAFFRADLRIERFSWGDRIPKTMALMGKLFGRPKVESVEVKPSFNLASERLFQRARKRILAKYKATIRKLEP
jgi:hypothetical protein